MKKLCRDCHEHFCTVEPGHCPRDEFISGDCEHCGKFIEGGFTCYGYDFRSPKERGTAIAEAFVRRQKLSVFCPPDSDS
jgi:hypothetical protein